jgi:hypothetical protein
MLVLNVCTLPALLMQHFVSPEAQTAPGILASGLRLFEL